MKFRHAVLGEFETGITPTDADEIMRAASDIWRQVGVDFLIISSTDTITVTDSKQFDLVDDDNASLAAVTTLGRKPGIDVYFVQTHPNGRRPPQWRYRL